MIEQIKKRIIEYSRLGKETGRDILKLVISEAQQKNKFDNDTLISIINKLIESNLETLRYGHNPKLIRENEVLKEFLPEILTLDQLMSELSTIKNELMENSGGREIGVALKYLKSKKFYFNNKDVQLAIKQIKD